MSKYKAPSFNQSSFNCPHCGALANQTWGKIFLELTEATISKDSKHERIKGYHASVCFSCEKMGLWEGYSGKLLYPIVIEGHLPDPNQVLDEDIQNDYLEARSIIHLSRRGPAAILRLCLQKLCVQLGQKGKNINEDISALVKKGLDSKVQQALDIVRVVGNYAVHPGELDLKDDSQTALTLLSLINLIAEVMISQPKHIQTLYDSLPAGAIQAIEKRDS